MRLSHWLHTVRDFLSKRPEAVFALVAIIFGGFFLVAVPPFQVPDEYAHFAKAYSISELNVKQDNLAGGYSGALLPKALEDYRNYSTQNNITHDREVKYSIAQMRAGASIKVDSEDRVAVPFVNFATYSPVAYMPQVLGIWLADLLTDRVAIMFYAARLCNLIFFIVMGFIALRVSRYGAWSLLFVVCLPMTLFLAGSLSADVSVIAYTLLLTSFTASLWMARRDLGKKEYVLLALIAMLLALSKQAYIVMLPVILLLAIHPCRSLDGKLRVRVEWRKLGALLAVILIAVTVLFGWLWLNRGVNSDISILAATQGQHIVPEEQTHGVLDNPLGFIGVLSNTIFTNQSNGVIMSAIGTFGLLNVQLPYFAIILMILTVILGFGYSGKSNKSLPKVNRRLYGLLAGLLIALTTVGVLTGLYITWSPVGDSYVSGLQGRYFIPLLILLVPGLVGLYKHTIRLRTLLACVLVVYVSVVMTILSRYYGIFELRL